MWLVLFFSIFSASLKFLVAEQVVQGQLKYSPSILAPLPYVQSNLNFSTGVGIKSAEVPAALNNINGQFARPQSSSENCPQIEILQNILALLKRLLNRDDRDSTYDLQPNDRLQILHSLKKYLPNSGPQVSEIDNRLKLVARTDKSFLLQNEASSQTISDNRNNVEANLRFKYDVPATKTLDCKEALATLVQTVKNAYSQVLKYCNLSGKCNLNLEANPLSIAYGDNSPTLYSNPALDKMRTQTQIMPSNPNLFNVYDTGSSLNNLVESNNQVLSQKSNSNDNFNSHAQAQSELNNNGYLTTNGLSNIVQIQSNEENKFDAYNKIHLNEKIQSSIQNIDKSNLLNGFPSFRHPYQWNIPNIQSPVNNLEMIPQNEVNPRAPNDYLDYYAQPVLNLNRNNMISNSALNSGIYQIKSEQTENVATTNNKHFNIIDNNNIKGIINTPVIANNVYNSIPMLQAQNSERYVPLNYNNNPNRQLYTISRLVNDKSSSVATFNQKNQNTKNIKYEGVLNPSHEFKNLNYPTHIDPYQNKNMRLTSPGIYFNKNIKQNPYLTSVNVNRQNSFNYNFKQANAKVQSDFGINRYPQTNFVDYPKHYINGNKLLDSNRLASVPNLVKLNTVADNEGIVELTYELKRPQSLSSNPDSYVKFRMPYRDFVSKINDLFRDPYIRSNPLKVHQELLSITNLAETSPDLVNIQRDEASKLILNNGGILRSAEVVGIKDSNANEYLKTIQSLNAKLNTNEILNLVRNDSSIAVPHSGTLSYPNVNQQYINDEISLRSAQFDKEFPIIFLPAKYDNLLLNPTNPLMMLANLNKLRDVGVSQSTKKKTA